MRTLSRGDIHLFDIDNPKHERYVLYVCMYMDCFDVGIGMSGML